MKTVTITRTTILSMLLLSIIFIMASCGGGSGTADKENSWNSTEKTAGPLDTLANKGLGPVQSVTLGAIDPAMAEKGKAIFTVKCATCHKFDKKYVGPPLYGITKRRAPEWIMNQVLNPAQMIKEDPISKALFEKYLVPMTFQNITQDDARNILEYLRETDSK